MADTLLDDLQMRGLVYQTSSDALGRALDAGPITAYIGFDPTADSLHVGSLLQLVTLRRLQLAGHRPIGLVGGGTGLIGDPSFKAGERALLDSDLLGANLAGIRREVEQFIDFAAGGTLVDNADWLCDLPLVDFLRDIGKHFSVNQMITRDSVRTRLEEREQGISYTEFTYMLLQAYDFLELFDRYGCTLQMGGRDQWGNIVAGIDLVRRKRDREVFGLTLPLITKADGQKFGKSESGTVWLNPDRTSPYQFYQFWLNSEDERVVDYLRYFTFRSAGEYDELAAAVAAEPERREAQRVLAEDVTTLVHGADGLARARKVSQVLFDKQADFRDLSARELKEAFLDAPRSELPAARLGTPEAALVNVASDCGLYPSRGRARKDIPQGGLSVNNVAIRAADHTLGPADTLPGGYIVLRKGKKTYHVLIVVES